MNVVKIIGIVLIVAGVLGLVYGQFTYTKDTHTVDLGGAEISVKEKETVQIPIWAGVISIAVGCVLLFIPRRRASRLELTADGTHRNRPLSITSHHSTSQSLKSYTSLKGLLRNRHHFK
ncbi:hypothetical protein [Mesotoga sp.]|uniref:hypothetical protein n=1 Tax=Mesotoga sp. TaxID=2053577 RepID=UPI00345EB8D4